ncbi:prenyltransferase/squalene oxidase repeat-containing protein [Schlesneria sp. T3-172]|uniref:prenyltransferase/squalene oxidase repeat-containing protein n=1 Tax=Schlesneria sphaerica TaxID=3373610 RepID=UPI0037C56AD9
MKPHFGEILSSSPPSLRSRPGNLRGNLLSALWFLFIAACFVGSLSHCQVASAQTQTTVPSPNARSFEARGHEFITPETQKAIDRGLVFLANRQHDEGWYFANSYKRNVAVTSLAGMAFLSAGHVPDRGPYGKKVDKSVEYILSCVSPSGFIKRDDSPEHGPMYGHGFATLFLAEVYGMSPKPEIRESLKSATQLIINSQNKEGGWRYKPDGRDADVSVTVCQMMALRAARNCGIAVPKTTVDNCVEYVRKCQNADGGFRYRLGDRPMSEFPRSAAGVVVLYNAGVTDGRDLERGLGYLLRFPPRQDLIPTNNHYFYGHYYAVQAMWHAGEENWRQWYPAIRDELLARQGPDGGWTDLQINDVYGTSMACLILQMPNNLLPIFQR